ncbi:protein chain elongation factor EF-G, GTP-binding (fragment) [Mesorhizobium plurifarium]|uniref:Protein chain elongation factor EF-G, GTP-binding n=1 Tax=Mesorhizobium plurifarium TaxID=69974 RepID=A0A0K2VSL4_MESPL
MMKISGAPWPLLQLAIEPKSRADEKMFRAALAKLAEERSDFEVKRDEESGQTIIAAMNELDLDIIFYRLTREFNVAVNVGAPQVAYRETITHAREQDYTHKRLFAGQGQFARVKVLFEPNGHNPDFMFVSRVPDGAFPGDYAAAVEKGVRSILVAGPYAGFPMIGIKATLVDATCHDSDSSPSAFEVASRACFKEAAPSLGVQLLEPIMKVEVVTPENYLIGIVGDLHGRRGLVKSRTSHGEAIIVNAMVPLATMFKYVENLRSMSRDRATYAMQFDHYAPVPRADRDPPPPPAVAAYG